MNSQLYKVVLFLKEKRLEKRTTKFLNIFRVIIYTVSQTTRIEIALIENDKMF